MLRIGGCAMQCVEAAPQPAHFVAVHTER
jgi:hypothetical protein